MTAAPYWAYHAAMAPLLAAFRPLVAEKIFLSWYVIAFAVAAWYFTKAGAGKPSALGLLFFVAATSYPFQMGFFNFMLGLPLFLLTAAYFWSRRENADGRFWVVLNLLVTVCYFTHLAAAMAAIISVWVMSFWSAPATPRLSRLFRAPLYLAPSYLLPLYYFVVTPKGGERSRHALGWLARELVSANVFVSFGPAQRPVAWAVASFCLLLLTAAVANRLRGSRVRLGPPDGFAALAALFVAIYFAAPGAVPPGAYYLSERMALFPFLLAVPWLAANIPRPLARPATWVAAALALANLVPLGRYYGRENAKLKIFNSGRCAVGPGAVLLPIIKDPTVRGRRIEALRQAVAYYVVSNEAGNLVDMGASVPHFPIKWVPGVVPPSHLGTFTNLRVYDVETARPAPDYVISYDINPFLTQLRPFFERYRPVYFKGKLIIYKRVTGPAAPPALRPTG
ncbi:MAG: hypothetical protein GTN49_11635 [candidate division Zixibacteria bacterium]|nr:hypothetical protein [candidate division Zixibacteria bacterium]